MRARNGYRWCSYGVIYYYVLVEGLLDPFPERRTEIPKYDETEKSLATATSDLVLL
jgi:hypothetical protein